MHPGRRQQGRIYPEHQTAKDKSKTHRWIDDEFEQAAFHHLECFGLFRALFGLRVIDKQTRQVQHPRHPRDDCNNMQRLDPEIIRGEKFNHPHSVHHISQESKQKQCLYHPNEL